MGGYLDLEGGELRRSISWRQRLLQRTSVWAPNNEMKRGWFTMVSGQSFVRCRCVAGGLGGLWPVFNIILQQMKKEEN